MDNQRTEDGKKPNMKMLLVILAAIVILALVVMLLSSKQEEKVNAPEGSNNVTTEQEEGGEPAPGEEMGGLNMVVTDAGQVIPQGSRVEIVGANPILDNVVVTHAGQVAKNDVVPMSPEAPQQTAPISKDQVPASATKLELSSSGFNPAKFEVKAGAPVTLSVSSVDTITHVFVFENPVLSAIAIGVGPNETRAITFNAPTEKGEYSFRCDVSGHANRGEVGVMIVK